MNDATGSVRRRRPSSTSIITAVVVATTFVSDARSKIVSSVIGSRAGTERALAVGLPEHDRVAAADDDHGARELAWRAIASLMTASSASSRARSTLVACAPAVADGWARTPNPPSWRPGERQPARLVACADYSDRVDRAAVRARGLPQIMKTGGPPIRIGRMTKPSRRSPRHGRRRSRRRLVILAGLAVGLAAVWFWAARPGRPHAYVLISIDTFRADRLPVYGYSQGRTPTLSALANEAHQALANIALMRELARNTRNDWEWPVP